MADSLRRRLLNGFCALCLSGALVAAAAENVTLNFVNAEVAAVVKTMADITGRTIVVDPRVKGTLYITSPRPVTPQAAYEILLAALRMQGYAAVEADGVVRVLPEADAKFYAAPAAGRGKAKVKGEMVTRVFALRHESATQLLQAVRPLVGANSAISAESGSNTLVVTDYATNLDRLARIIETLDTPGADDPVLVPLKYASAQEIANLVSRVYRSATGGNAAPGTAGGAAATEVERLDVAVDARSNSLILRSRNRSLVARVQNMVVALDTPTPAAGNVHVIYLKNAEAVKVAETLRRVLSADAGALAPSVPAAAKAAAGAPGASAAPAPAEGGPGMIQADAASNALIITAPEALFASIRAMVEKLDVRRAQVLVEALIAEVSADKATEFGIQWFDASGGKVGNTDPKFFGGFANSQAASNIASVAANPVNAARGLNIGLVNGQLTLPGNITVLNLGVLARALETQADANILSTPTLMTLDNEEAKISVGANVPFSTGQYTLTANAATPFQTIERRDVGLTLKVKPQISEGGTVRLQIYQEVSKLRQQAESVTLATTDKRSIESTVLVDDGQIVVLGGLIEDQVQDVEDKVPVLGDVPLFGHLFRYSTRRHTKTNLMVFLRPVVVRDGRAAAALTHPRYDYIQGRQRAAAGAEAGPALPDRAPAPPAAAADPAAAR